MRILFAGTPETAAPSLDFLVNEGHEVVGVITREDAPIGRKRVPTPSPVAQVAERLGLDVFKANRLDEAATAWARSREADLGVIVAYGGLVREPLLSLPRLGWINLHFSALPQWRGAAPVQRALMAGEQRLGLTVFRLVEALDAGDVLAQDMIDIAPGIHATAALKHLASAGRAPIQRAIHLLENDSNAGTPQQGEASYAHKLSREDGRLDLSRSVKEVVAHWAGVTSEPGAFVEFEGQPLKLHELAFLSTPQPSPALGAKTQVPGTVRLAGGRAILDLADGSLELVRVQPAGKAAMSGADWLRGRGGEAVLS